MRVVHCYAGADGQSHLEDLEIPVEDIGTGRSSALLPVTGIAFWETPEAFQQDWHPAGRAQWMLVLDGSMVIECRDGSSATISAGEVLLANDTTGGGHLSSCPGSCRAALVPLGAGFDPSLYRMASAAERA